MKRFTVITIAFVFLLVLLHNVPNTVAQDWPMFRHDLANTGQTTSVAPRDNNLLWKFYVGNLVNSNVVVVGGKVFFGSWATLFESSDKNLFCLDASNGRLIWSQLIGSARGQLITVIDNKVFINSEEGVLYTLSAENGDNIWSYQAGAGGHSSPAVVEGVVFIGSGDGRVYALNAENGDNIWSYQTDDTIYLSSPAIVGGVVFIGSEDGRVYALNAENGDNIWSYQTGEYIHSSPAVVEGVVFIGSGDGRVYALNAENGDNIWSYQTDDKVRSSPAVYENKLFVGQGSPEQVGQGGKVYSLNAENGDYRWVRSSSWAYTVSSPAVTNGKVFTTLDDFLVCISAESGDTIWSYKLADETGTSLALADNKVFVGDREGNTWAFGTLSPVIEIPAENQKLFGTAELSGIAEGDAVQSVELNLGNGWIEVDMTPTQEENFRTTRYLNRWSYSWDTAQVPDNAYEVRVRIRYGNGEYSDETTITVTVENPAQIPPPTAEFPWLAAGALAIVLVAVVLIASRAKVVRRGRVR